MQYIFAVRTKFAFFINIQDSYRDLYVVLLLFPLFHLHVFFTTSELFPNWCIVICIVFCRTHWIIIVPQEEDCKWLVIFIFCFLFFISLFFFYSLLLSQPCYRCHGKGQVRCTHCHGRGRVSGQRMNVLVVSSLMLTGSNLHVGFMIKLTVLGSVSIVSTANHFSSYLVKEHKIFWLKTHL